MMRAALPPAGSVGLRPKIAQRVAIDSQGARRGVALDLEEAEKFLGQLSFVAAPAETLALRRGTARASRGRRLQRRR